MHDNDGLGPLRTGRLFLRKLELQDAGQLLGYRSLEDVRKYQLWHPKNPEDVEAFIRNPGPWIQLGICLEPELLLIGDLGVHFLPDSGGQAEFGVTLSPDFQGKGYASEAVMAVFDMLFHTYGLHRITASVDPGNLPSLALMERVGMRKEGHFIKSLLHRGEWLDDVVFAMLDEEWAERRARIPR